jgi:hypothetical protein
MSWVLQDCLMSYANAKPVLGRIGHRTFLQKRGPCALAHSLVDETGETVAVATILTMVRKLDQSM